MTHAVRDELAHQQAGVQVDLAGEVLRQRRESRPRLSRALGPGFNSTAMDPPGVGAALAPLDSWESTRRRTTTATSSSVSPLSVMARWPSRVAVSLALAPALDRSSSLIRAA